MWTKSNQRILDREMDKTKESFESFDLWMDLFGFLFEYTVYIALFLGLTYGLAKLIEA